MDENTQLYREGYMIQTPTRYGCEWGKEGGLTEETDGGSIANHVLGSVHGGLSGELPEGGQIHLYFFL